MIVPRKLKERLIYYASKMPIVSLTGPRQSGKTVLVKEVFKDYAYFSLENPQNLNFAISDPVYFLKSPQLKMIIDEAQKAPELFSYIQGIVDENNIPGQFILTGSQNFLLSEKISQSLAGRVAILKLLPFSYYEIENTDFQRKDLNEYIFSGFYPRIYDQGLKPQEWLASYLETYVEKDVRQILNISSLFSFQNFMRICAGRIGQVLNYSNMANELGVSYHTVQDWLSILENSYITFRLPAYYKNFNKRIIKSPKLYFYDTGLACYLLNIIKPAEIDFHFAKGGLFESFVLSEMIKLKYNEAERANFFFWRNQSGNEVDCIMEEGQSTKAIEIKSGKTINPSFFKGLEKWEKLHPESSRHVVYGGDLKQKRTKFEVLGWKQLNEIRNQTFK